MQALQNMAFPWNIKEVHSLVGQIIALSQFISQSIEKSSHPSFKILCKAARLMRCLRRPSLILRPTWQITYPVQACRPRTPAVVFVCIRGTPWFSFGPTRCSTQQFIYFSSHMLKNVEMCYIVLEKLALAVIWFLVNSDLIFYHIPSQCSPSVLGKALTNPEASGRLISRPSSSGSMMLNISREPQLKPKPWLRLPNWQHKKPRKFM